MRHPRRQVLEADDLALEPLGIRLLRRDGLLRLLVGTIRPCARSTRKSLPGWRRPLRTMFSAGMSSTPVSDASTTQPSFVSSQRPGRSPLRSSVAPMTRPSVNEIAAGPSHASIRH
jgi:hypothetical protein